MYYERILLFRVPHSPNPSFVVLEKQKMIWEVIKLCDIKNGAFKSNILPFFVSHPLEKNFKLILPFCLLIVQKWNRKNNHGLFILVWPIDLFIDISIFVFLGFWVHLVLHSATINSFHLCGLCFFVLNPQISGHAQTI